MARKTTFILTLLLAAVVRAGHAEQDAPRRFRARVDLITVDVSAVDSKGKPVEDLRPGDFTVKVDGKSRSVVSADLVRVDRAKGSRPQSPVDALIASNVSAINARHVVIAVDQTLITPGTLTPLLRTASQFVDRLAPADYAAFIGFPEPGPRVDFTTDKTAVRSAMQTISIGQPSKIPTSNFDISLYEAFAITGAESIQNADRDSPPGPVMQPVLARAMDSGACELVPPPMTCKQAIYNESRLIAAEARVEGNISLRALESLLKDLVPLEGRKTMVIFSAGMVAEDPGRLDDVARLAAAARTTINVIAVDRDRGEFISERNILSRSALADRSFELEGLEGIADRANGRLFRAAAGNGAGFFEPLESQLSAWYVVAVARQPNDIGELKIDVDVRRRGVALRSNRTIVAGAVNPNRSIDELLSDALSSPYTLPGLALRISTFTQRDAEPGKYRLRVAADIGQPGEPAGDFAIGYVLTDPKGRVVTSAGSRRTLSPEASGPGQVLHHNMTLSVAPGAYALRVAAVHQDGRRGTVVHRIELPKLAAGEIATSDLIVGNLPAEGETLSPRVEPQVTASELAGYLELYLPDSRAGSVAVTLAIAEGEASPALATEMLTLRPGESPSSLVATGFVPATMTPGRYVARATVSREGVAVKTLSRPFTIVRDPAVVSKPSTRTRGMPITPQLQRLTANYVAGVVNGLGNPVVVAEEDFKLSRPDRRVTSDLWLVGYPGMQRDLLPFREVVRVNGKPVPGREQRRLDLFITPTDRLRDQARKIMLSGEEHVPLAFNPMFVLAFLQSDNQARFQFTVNDAGKDWPPEVKAVTFVEVGRPTLLRQGIFGDIDVPTRGTAWIEETTGRIRQTELEVGRGRTPPTMVTKFGVDDRLQVTVPVEMRTRNPEGIATYTNFRRFGVGTDINVPLPRSSDPPQP